jgi:hypothetical protein
MARSTLNTLWSKLWPSDAHASGLWQLLIKIERKWTGSARGLKKRQTSQCARHAHSFPRHTSPPHPSGCTKRFDSSFETPNVPCKHTKVSMYVLSQELWVKSVHHSGHVGHVLTQLSVCTSHLAMSAGLPSCEGLGKGLCSQRNALIYASTQSASSVTKVHALPGGRGGRGNSACSPWRLTA